MNYSFPKTRTALAMLESLTSHYKNQEADRVLAHAREELSAFEEPLLDLVEKYLKESGMGESYFGVKACGNSNFVKRLRDGSSFHWETVDIVRSFIADRLNA